MKLSYINEGLRLAKEKNLEAIQKDFTDKQKEIHKEISEANSKKIACLQSRPLRCKENDEGCRVKVNVHELLKNNQKDDEEKEKFHLTYDIFTVQKYKELHKIEHGCKLLVLDLAVEDEEGLVLEDDDLNRVVLSTDQAEVKRSETSGGASIEIVFFMSSCSEKQITLVEKFLEKLNVKILVWFKPPANIDESTLSNNLKFELLKRNFLIHFLNHSHTTTKAKKMIEDSIKLAIKQTNEMMPNDPSLEKGCILMNKYSEKTHEKNNEKIHCHFGSSSGNVRSSEEINSCLRSELIYENRFKEMGDICNMLDIHCQKTEERDTGNSEEESSTLMPVLVQGRKEDLRSEWVELFRLDLIFRKTFPHHEVYCFDLSRQNKTPAKFISEKIADLRNGQSELGTKTNYLIIFDNLTSVKDLAELKETFNQKPVDENENQGTIKIIVVADMEEGHDSDSHESFLSNWRKVILPKMDFQQWREIVSEFESKIPLKPELGTFLSEHPETLNCCPCIQKLKQTDSRF